MTEDRKVDQVGDMREIRRTCARIVATLNPPRPWDLKLFVEYVSQQIRHQPIHLVGRQLPPGVTSFWFNVAGRGDFIVYEEHSVPQHQLHLVLHEIGHMLLDHPSVDPAVLANPTLPLPYGGKQEHEAELLAGAILNRFGPSPVGEPVADDLARAMETFDPSWEATPHVRPILLGRTSAWRRDRRSGPVA
ncbi:ImmA/IrrE family metallo-endopeptidase [Catellatospora sichuanensis]|uniref:ImmA/IrrE family metallo-endopeptidase n=1 Tax=Catellatospora sichuanensis TaxID=1969805 RepID=UPI001184213F|nr:ImmA/IrrE family metallo-endopeptidase [Catellatospora sichuanensis]